MKKTQHAVGVPLEREVIRQILEDEISSQSNKAHFLARNNRFDEADRESAVRQGISRALELLAKRYGV